MRKKILNGKWIPWLFALSGYVLNLVWMAQNAWLTDSDMSGEMILSSLLNQEGTILSHNFYYSTELRVVSVQWFYRIGLFFFPDNWHAARVLGAALIIALFFVSYLFFAHSAGLKEKGIISAAALMWPFGRLFWYLALYGNYYLIYMILSLLCLGLMFQLLGKVRRKPVYLILLFLLSFLSGLNGVRQIQVFFLPLSAAAGILYLISVHHADSAEKTGNAKHLLFLSFGSLLFSAAGYWINCRVLAEQYSFYLSSSARFGSKNLLSSLISAFGDFLGLFGYRSDVTLFSLSGLASCLGILMAMFFLFSLYRLFRRFRSLSFFQQSVLILLCSALVIDGIAYSALDIVYSTGFWIPLIPFAFGVMQMEMDGEDYALPHSETILKTVFAGCIMLCSVSTLQQEIISPYRGEKGLYEVSQWLQDNGYAEGYASFWNSLAVTEMTSGKVDVWTVSDTSSTAIYPWLQKKDHQEEPSGTVFLLLNISEEDPQNNLFVQSGEGTEVYCSERYLVLVFDSAETMKRIEQNED